MALVLATRNPDKIREIRLLFESDSVGGVSLLTLLDFPDLPVVKEIGVSLEENAILKAQAVSQFTQKLALSDDTGLEVFSLQGKPGVFSARFAGPTATYKDNCKKLLNSLENVPEEKRRAIFRCIAALVSPEGWIVTFEGVTKGKIGFEPRGEGGFGYDPLFIVEGVGKTYAEMPLEEKNKISHRAQAMRKVVEYLSEEDTRQKLLENKNIR